MTSSYVGAGVDIENADAAKRAMVDLLRSSDPRVLNGVGAFASLFEASFPGYRRPVLVFKTEEPGTKQKLALQNGRIASLCRDLVHHLINDIVVMGAVPLVVQDAIICGRLERAIVTEMVAQLAAACREQECALTGGETSEQPGVLSPGTYILTASVVGVVEREHIKDGTRIEAGDVVLAVASNGLHTNGYSLVRALLDKDPTLTDTSVEGEPFLEVVLRPHRCYFHPLKELLSDQELHGMAHITGGGIGGNVRRVIPPGLHAAINLNTIRIPRVFQVIRAAGSIVDTEMLRTFNLGVGLVLIAAAGRADTIRGQLVSKGCDCYPIGRVETGDGEGRVTFTGRLGW